MNQRDELWPKVLGKQFESSFNNNSSVLTSFQVTDVSRP